MARIGNIFSIVANFLTLGEKRDQMLLLTLTKTHLFGFFLSGLLFPYQLCINTSISFFILLLYHVCAFLQLVV